MEDKMIDIDKHIYINNHNFCTKDKCKCIYIDYNDIGNKIITQEICSGNFCILCNVNIGDCNPRQYCSKTYCSNSISLY